MVVQKSQSMVVQNWSRSHAESELMGVVRARALTGNAQKHGLVIPLVWGFSRIHRSNEFRDRIFVFA
jgi:hypothetical protein